MTRAQFEFHRWLDYADPSFKEELESIRGDRAEIEYRFGQSLTFGTGGLRGVMMAGTNAMNVYTVAAATKGLADYIASIGRSGSRVIVGRDSRINSELFAKITASVLAANGFRVCFFDELRPTPMVSFGTRYFGCVAGVNITASHNPKEYNGYKVYFEDGAQISGDQAKAIAAMIEKTDVFSVKIANFDEAVADGRIVMVGRDFDEIYLKTVIAEQVDKTVLRKTADDLRVVYTPFHGAGYRLVPSVLRRTGLKHLYIVKSQKTPDGTFPTVKSPNPENPEGFADGIRLANRRQSDLVIATDPDCDRVGVVARNKKGEFETISGNCMGALLLDYILRAHTENGTMPPEPYAVKTIVTTDLARAVCDAYGVKLYNVLTGFKYIGEVIKKSEEAGRGSFILGYEESYGYLKGTYARDKDGVVASMLITEMAAYYKRKGMTLCDARDRLYKTYGYFAERTDNITMQGFDAAASMAALTDRIRENPPEEIGGLKVVAVSDYLSGKTTDLKTGGTSPTELPVSDVLEFTLEEGSRVIMRPSGTEPKIKIYLLCRGKTKKAAEKTLAACSGTVAAWA